MNKCVDCAYFLNCKDANEEKTCEKYKFIRKNIEKIDTQKEIKNIIEQKNIERQIADLFYKKCSNVPPQILASTVRQTIENFKELDNLYNPKIEKEYKANAIDTLKYIEGILSKDTIIGKPEAATIIKAIQKHENHMPRIE